MEKVEYVANSGNEHCLDGPRNLNRLAVAINDRITIYELKLSEEMCQMDGKSSIPSERAEFDITDAVVNLTQSLQVLPSDATSISTTDHGA